MVHAALGYAKASRRLATLACTASIGPGATNMLTGAATATTNRLPVLLLPGDTFANRRQGPVLQQLEHPIDARRHRQRRLPPAQPLLRPHRPARAAARPRCPRRCACCSTRPRPARSRSRCTRTCRARRSTTRPRSSRRATWPVARRAAGARARSQAAAALLRGARRPLLIAGGGVRHSEAEAALRRFAEDARHPGRRDVGRQGRADGLRLARLGGIGVNGTRAANELARAADVVLCVGTRLTDFTTGSHSLFQHPACASSAINVNAARRAQARRRLPVVADAREALDALRDALGGLARARRRTRRRSASARAAGARELEADLAPRAGEPMGQGEVLRALKRTRRGAGDWVVAAAG